MQTGNRYQLESEIYKKHDSAALNEMYTEGDGVDQEIFAEMRSNVTLVAGDHYNKRQSTFYKRIQSSQELSNEQKLRLTKNHIRRICQLYTNNIVAQNPGVGFSPKDESSMHDQKVADLHHSVWRDAFERYSIAEKIDDWVDSFVQIGEVAVKVMYDTSLGAVKGYEPQVDEFGQPVLDEMGQPVDDETKPIFTGGFVFDEIYGFNLLRPASCKDMREAEWIGLRKMTDKLAVVRQFGESEEVTKLIPSDGEETYVVFDGAKEGYKRTKQVMIREYYFRPSLLYPRGYYYITTKSGILAEGELPGGLFPIVFAPFDKIQTTPRGRSAIKQMRAYQAEINRSASKMAEHQITLGDDKLLIQNGTKVSAGVALPGIRSVNFTGQSPTILEGRSGAQYLDYMNSQISEMYVVMSVAEDSQSEQQNMDPYVLLFRSASKKKNFQRYIRRFERFLIDLVKLYIGLAKVHLPDDAVIWAIGKNEQVNLQEFRELPDTNYEVKVEAQSDDIETKLGKQIVLNHALQYIGPQLKPEQIGKIMKQMPFSNAKGAFDDLTLDDDSAMNDILSLDRGEKPAIAQYDNHLYNIKRLTARVRKADFRFVSPEIQSNYAQKIKMHEEFEKQNQLALQRAEQGFIPTGGPLAKVDLYVKDKTDPTGQKTTRAQLPMQALEWLTNQLEAQGSTQANYAGMNKSVQAEMATNLTGPAPVAPPQGGAPAFTRPNPAAMGQPPMEGNPMGKQPLGMNAGMPSQVARMGR